MNQKIEDLLKKRKQEKRENEIRNRNEHLIKLGLTEGEREEIQYMDYYNSDFSYDKEKQSYYIVVKVANAIEVTDEEYEKICLYSNPNDYTTSNAQTVEDSINIMVKNISTIKKIMIFFTVLWVIGVIASVILLLI